MKAVAIQRHPNKTCGWMWTASTVDPEYHGSKMSHGACDSACIRGTLEWIHLCHGDIDGNDFFMPTDFDSFDSDNDAVLNWHRRM